MYGLNESHPETRGLLLVVSTFSESIGVMKASELREFKKELAHFSARTPR